MRKVPFISAAQILPEITLKGFILGVLLALIMAVSNTFLALKIGVLTPSSIPAAIISMGILRLFARSNILENNQVQTCASAGEAIAGGVVYTAPALVIIHYWLNFNYFYTFLIALIGGTLGVLFTIPLRKVFMTERHLNFPEAKAIDQVLRMGTEGSAGLGRLMVGSVLGAVMELAQSGIKLFSNGISFFTARGTTVFGFGAGFSATLIGAGYLMGFEVGLSVLIGAIIASGICLPMLSHLYGPIISFHSTSDLQQAIMGGKVRYVGIGAMLVAGVWTLLRLLKPFYHSLVNSLSGAIKKADALPDIRTEKDIPGKYVLLGVIILFVLAYILFSYLFPLAPLGIVSYLKPTFLITSLIYILIIGFIFSAICGYFSGLVGVTASPGSSVAIATIMIAALIVRGILAAVGHVSPQDLQMGAAITIVLTSIVMGACCVANNNSQDLKVGHLVGATPWKQQLMLMTGGLVAALIIPVVMQLLYQVYGIAGAMPHPGMDPSLSLPAPPAAAMGAVAQGVFTQDLPWNMLGLGALIAIVAIIFRPLLKRTGLDLSVIGMAIGIYLPLSSSTPLFIGALISLLVKKYWSKRAESPEEAVQQGYSGMVLSCGLVAGAAIMDVLLAIPFAIMHNPDALSILPASMGTFQTVLGILAAFFMCFYIYRSAVK